MIKASKVFCRISCDGEGVVVIVAAAAAVDGVVKGNKRAKGEYSNIRLSDAYGPPIPVVGMYLQIKDKLFIGSKHPAQFHRHVSQGCGTIHRYQKEK